MRQKGVGLAQRSACERIGFSEIGAERIRAGLMKVVLAGWVLPADGSPLARSKRLVGNSRCWLDAVLRNVCQRVP